MKILSFWKIRGIIFLLYLLEIPAGTMEPGELPPDCARRELEEETGYVAEEFSELSQVLILPV